MATRRSAATCAADTCATVETAYVYEPGTRLVKQTLRQPTATDSTRQCTEVTARDAFGQPTAVRAVGLANGANPVSIVVPCHRVIGADGSLTGYGGGLDRKRWLLDHEKQAVECAEDSVSSAPALPW